MCMPRLGLPITTLVFCKPHLSYNAKSLGEQFRDQSTIACQCTLRWVRRRRIDPVLFIYTRCHSCKNQIVKDQSQQASTAASSVTTVLSIVVNATSCDAWSRWWTEAESMPVKAEVRHWPRPLTGHPIEWPSCGDPHRHRFLSEDSSVLSDGGETGNLTQRAACVKGSCPRVFPFWLANLLLRETSRLGLPPAGILSTRKSPKCLAANERRTHLPGRSLYRRF